ncbi:hypothetical protein [Streptomyces sp. A1547]|uniref:hypothetical protein n=1 Tax=Streptomyces sp. A1547 TaxID=2563105 RepID=UPI00109EBA6A|nr:hypothetical protein [Streptomyces sp. A1547]THA36020.1 hypothetical protein E6W17_26220 [Streptomyces sp. A1547]
MRTALRTSIVTAALAGALLAPAATALAAPAPQAVTSVTAVTTVSAASSDKGRYDGEAHLVADGRIAVLRNDVEGPEVWIRAVGADWKPADGVAGRVLAKLDPSNPVALVDGIQYKLSEGNPGSYGLTVRVMTEGAADFYELPKATTPTKPSAQPSAKPSAQPAATSKVTVKPAADVKPQTGAQTVVVPQGAVAAGAEIAAEDTDNSTTMAAGAGLVAIFGVLGVARMARARRARNGA